MKMQVYWIIYLYIQHSILYITQKKTFLLFERPGNADRLENVLDEFIP